MNRSYAATPAWKFFFFWALYTTNLVRGGAWAHAHACPCGRFAPPRARAASGRHPPPHPPPLTPPPSPPPPPTPSPQCMYTFFGQFLVYCTPNPLVAQLLSAFFNQLWTIFNGACVRCVWCVVCVGGGVGEQ